jgi:hypothetical protein
MTTLTIRDPYGNTFEVDTYARPYWEGREGYEILSDPEPDSLPQGDQPAASPDKTGTPKTTMQRAARAAQDVKEQPGG